MVPILATNAGLKKRAVRRIPVVVYEAKAGAPAVDPPILAPRMLFSLRRRLPASYRTIFKICFKHFAGMPLS
jgi:hypothetical protein